MVRTNEKLAELESKSGQTSIKRQRQPLIPRA